MIWINYFLAIFFFAFTSCAVSQPVVKTYAWQQDVIPGAIPITSTEENGDGAVAAKPFTSNYFIYLSHEKSTTILPEHLWINGACYRFTIDSVKSTPVTKVIPNQPLEPTTVVLVPKTAHSLVQLKVSEQIDTTCTLPAVQKKNMEAGGVVIGYNFNGKLYYTTAAPLQRIRPALHQ